MNRRIVCVRIPHSELAYGLKRHPDWHGCPVILVEKEHGKSVVKDASRAARDAGIGPGMTTTQAVSIEPHAQIVPVDGLGTEREWERLAILLGRFSPIVELAAPGLFYLDGHGMGRLYKSEREYISHLRFTLQGEGYHPRVSIAGSRYAAYGAGFLGTIEAVPLSHDARALSQLSIDLLPMSAGMHDAFETLGLRTIGAVAGMPIEQLEARFGPEGVQAGRLARGEDPTPLRGYYPPNLTASELELDGPVEGTEPLRFVLKTLTDRLVGALAERGLACEEARLHLRLDNRDTVVMGIIPAAPTLSAPLLWELARTRLEKDGLASGVVHLRFEAVRVSPAEYDQQALFSRSPNQERVGLAVARLRGIVGDEGVLIPRRAANYRPEKRLTWLNYIEAEPSTAKKKGRTQRPRRRRRASSKPKESAYAPLLYRLPFEQG